MMIPLQYWKPMLTTVQWLGGILGVINNFILLLLIIYRSPKHLGAYKYLMIYIAINEIAFSIFDAIVEPNVFSHGPVYMVFRHFKHSNIGRAHGAYLLSVHAGTYALTISLFGVHFVYRYGVADSVFWRRYLTGKKLVVLFLIPLIIFVCWTGVVILFFQPSQDSDSLMR
ncbi:unnamed protein product [Caenorhabditis nigoni]